MNRIKKFVAVLLVAMCTASVVFGLRYVIDSGLLRPYPEPTYLTEEEADVRPLYQQLSEEEKALYTALYRGVSGLSEEIELPYEIKGETYARLYCMLEKQEAELFWLDSSYYMSEKLRTAKMIGRENVKAGYSDMAEELERKSQEILDGLPENAADYEKALYIHDYITENCVYEAGMDSGYNSTAYGCLVLGEALCEGYAKAFDYLAKKAGLGSVVVTGVTYEGENHAWNQAMIDGEWYNIDVTWDDTDADDENVHVYFLQNDEQFSVTHTPDSSPEYFTPFKCGGNEDYFVRNNLYTESDEETQRILIREISAGTGQIELRFGSEELYDVFSEDYAKGERIFNLMMIYGAAISDGSLSISLTEYEEDKCVSLSIG